MSTNPASQPDAWDIHEEMCLRLLDQDEASLRRRVTSLYARFWDSSEDIKAILDELNHCQNLLFERKPIGTELWNQGRPRFDEKVNGLIAYVQAEYRKFTDVYRSKLMTEATLGRAQSRFVPQAQSVFNLAAWRSVFNHTCINCGRLLGDYYYSAPICPRCKAYPRPS